MVDQWFWMMEYCKEHHYPPAQNWAWERARDAYKNRDIEK